MHTTGIGNQAEDAAAAYLQARGFTILARNWRHRRAEIDIIACYEGTAYFVEVKYRRRSGSGRGLEYITSKKLHQMSFACDLWLVYNHWYGPYQLSALEVSGEQFAVTAFVPSLYE